MFEPPPSKAKSYHPITPSPHLFVIGTINLIVLFKGKPTETSRFARWLSISHPFLAIPIGALFGLGFETASQMSAWALAGTIGHGIAGALSIASAFGSGMVVTDTINGLVVRRLYLTAARKEAQNGRMMTIAVVGLAYGIRVIKLLQRTEFALPITDFALTLAVLGIVFLASAAAMVHAKRPIFN